MKRAFAEQHFDAVDEPFICVAEFLGGLSAGFLQTVFRNGYGDCSQAVRAEENPLSEHYKREYLLL
jgi:hypothetical protein